jgi:hypothetical protein
MPTLTGTGANRCGAAPREPDLTNRAAAIRSFCSVAQFLRLVRHHDGGVDGRVVGYILQGRIRAGGIEKDVIFLDADPNLNAVKR